MLTSLQSPTVSNTVTKKYHKPPWFQMERSILPVFPEKQLSRSLTQPRLLVFLRVRYHLSPARWLLFPLFPRQTLEEELWLMRW